MKYISPNTGTSQGSGMLRSLIIFSMIAVILSSCGSSDGVSRVQKHGLKHSASAEVLTANMELVVHSVDAAKSGTIEIVVRNPQSSLIQSVRSWVRFDPEEISIKNLTLKDTRFSLFAPDEQEIDSDHGFIKFGGASLEPITDTEITLMSFDYEKLGDKDTVLTFYDWKANGDGHAAVVILNDNITTNILQIPSHITL